ncbi:MAG: hypothetical protein QNJ47_14700 [Nostocaceae cyanobacterium]|nr:hypothetical protein [Nostocaceae cyanobacterium]
MSQISHLTPQQEALISTYREKWRDVAISTQPINRQQAQMAVEALYTAVDKPKPEILFFDGPEALEQLLKQHSLKDLRQQFGMPEFFMVPIAGKIISPVQEAIEPSLWQQLQEQLMDQQTQQVFLQRRVALTGLLGEINTSDSDTAQILAQIPQDLLAMLWENQQRQWRSNLHKQPGGDILLGLGDWFGQQWQPIGQQLDNIFKPLVQPTLEQIAATLQPFLVGTGAIIAGFGVLMQFAQDTPVALIDFCTQVLGCKYDSQLGNAIKAVTQECGDIIPCEKVCLVIERPSKLLLDEQNRLHGEGEPAIAYPDGYQQYFFHGVNLPPKYAGVHPHQWQASWLLTEENAELRRALIQGIGYARICQELAAVEIDSWREYTLLRIDQNVDIESIYLLKMTCPSTGFIHATRVPPSMESAREAIRWVNWDVDPQEFAVES